MKHFSSPWCTGSFLFLRGYMVGQGRNIDYSRLDFVALMVQVRG